MVKYSATVDPNLVNTSHSQILQLVGSDKAVLDVGCASGYLAQALRAQGCTVSGIEYDEQAAREAAPHLEKLVVGDVTAVDFAEEFGAAAFDVIVFGDVLEHLVDPATVLSDALASLRPDGEVVVSLPNVAHGSVRLALLNGYWEYTPTGLLDETHVRFFTKRTLLELMAGAGLEVVELRGTTADPLRVEVEVHDEQLPSSTVQWVRERPEALVYQYVLRARRSSEGEVAVDPDMAVVPAAELEPLRDHHYERATREAAEQRELRHRLLTQRDHIIGLEATTAKALADAQKARDELERAGAAHRRELEALREEYLGSATWRIGRRAVAPVAWARHKLGGRP
jgi:2-polyprenyl-3-methyl-5-hydroxy-6-metoxy-1,4-benzoquinol methylase